MQGQTGKDLKVVQMVFSSQPAINRQFLAVEKCTNHDSLYDGRNSFCRHCELYLPKVYFAHKNGAKVYRGAKEAARKLKINPNTELEMMYRKQTRSTVIELTSEQIAYRELSLQKIKELSIEHSLSQVIMATTYTYFDLLIERMGPNLNEGDYHNYVLGCLLIATKFHEGCQVNSKSGVIAKYLKNLLEEHGMRSLELKIANFLDWNLDLQTPIQFVNYFISRGKPLINTGAIFSSDCFENKENNRIEETLTILEFNAHKAAVASFFDISINKYTPFVVAAACIAYGRMKSSITPVWPLELEHLSGLLWKDVERAFQAIQNVVKTAEKSVSNKSLFNQVNTFEFKPEKLEKTSQDQNIYLGKRIPIADQSWRKVLGEINVQSGSRKSGSFFFNTQASNTNFSHFKL